MPGKYYRGGKKQNKEPVKKRTLFKLAAVPQTHTMNAAEASTSDRQVMSPILAPSLPQTPNSGTCPILSSPVLMDRKNPMEVCHLTPVKKFFYKILSIWLQRLNRLLMLLSMFLNYSLEYLKCWIRDKHRMLRGSLERLRLTFSVLEIELKKLNTNWMLI